MIMAESISSKGEKSWHAGKSLLECHQHMFENQVACDVSIQFSASEQNETIGAHRYILMCRSPIFEAMLTGEFVRDAAGASVTIDMPDTEPVIFKEVLKYMYNDSTNIAANNVLHVLHNAKKYQLDGLAKQCMIFLENNISVANACTLLNTCTFDEVVDLCVQYTRSHPTAVLGSANFLSLSQDALNRILAYGLMYDQKEIFDVCIKWARHQHEHVRVKNKGEIRSLREILGKCLYHLGFRSMTSAELAAATKDAPVLSDAEQLALFRYAALPDDETTTALDAIGFTNPPVVLTTRSWFDGVEIEKHTFGNHHGDELHSSLSFSVDKPITVLGIGIFGTEKTTRCSLTMELHADQKTERSLLAPTEPQPLCSFDTKIWSRGGRDPIRLVLPEPTELQPTVGYRIHVILGNMKKSTSHVFKGIGQSGQINCGHCIFTLGASSHNNNGLISQILYRLT